MPQHVETSEEIRFGIATGALALTAIGALIAALAPKDGAPVGVVLWPGTPLGDAIEIVETAGGSVLDFGRVSWLVVAASQNLHFQEQLKDRGALFTIDGTLASALCTSPGGIDES